MVEQIEPIGQLDLEIPKRSRLYSLDPIGVGTPWVESLTSYIIRLADAHCVSPGKIVRKVILPEIGKTQSKENLIAKIPEYVNGIGERVNDWVFTVQRLTEQKSLECLTMLSYSSVLAHAGLIRKHLAWCPMCLAEWKHEKSAIYYPIIWFLQPVKSCLKHGCLLVTEPIMRN